MGTATGREASLHSGGLTSQQTRNGWPRGKKNQITRAPSGWRHPSSLESPHAIKSVTLTASYDITSLSASLSLHAGRCHCMLAVYLAASTSLSTSLSLHAGRLRRPAELSRVEDAGPRPILSETFFKHLRTWELENDFNLFM